MNEYTFNPNHGKLDIRETPGGVKEWAIYLNERGRSFLWESLADPMAIVHIKGEIEGQAWFRDNLYGTGPLIKTAALK